MRTRRRIGKVREYDGEEYQESLFKRRQNKREREAKKVKVKYVEKE